MGFSVWYLGHSGFAAALGSHLLIFDYYDTRPAAPGRGLESGVVDKEALAAFDTVTVFSSHAHHDHFNPVILSWAGEHPNIRYVLSHDIRKTASLAPVTKACPDETYDLGDMQVSTLPSTDEGVAFVVSIGGRRLYHAGDLNWWHWEGEPEEDNLAQERDYKAQMEKLRGLVFDAAFVPVDPRLEKQALWGLRAFMEAADARAVFPMHFWEDYSVFDRLEKDPAAAHFRDRVKRIAHRGERFDLA